MKRFKWQILFDISMWCTVYFAFFQGSEYANNVYYLHLIVLSMVGLGGVIALFMSADDFSKNMEKSDYKTNGFKKWYGRITTLIEMVMFAGIGWFYSATICLVLYLNHFRVYQYLEEKQDEN